MHPGLAFLHRLRLAALLRCGAAGLLAMALTGCAPLQAARGPDVDELPGRVGRLLPVAGTVWVQEPDARSWSEAYANRPLIEGDRVATDDDARAELQIGSTVLRLDERSELELVRLDDRRIAVELRRGTLALSVASEALAEEIEVLTDEGRVQPLARGHYRVDRDERRSHAGVWRGELQLSGRGNLRRLERGDRVAFWRDDDGQLRTRERRMPDDRFDDWAQAEHRRWLAAYDGARHAPAEMTGVHGLEAHGRWQPHPQHGMVWVPHQVPAGWAPYREGRWIHMRGYGWTWVDAAPWGFAPFHYGRWVQWHGRWVWWPGRWATPRPHYAPALVAWVGTPDLSVAVSIGSPGPAGWVPLAPHEVYVPTWHLPPPIVVPVHPYPRPTPMPRPRPRPTPQPVPTGPIMYTDKGVAAGVQAVPSQVLKTAPAAQVQAAPPPPAAIPGPVMAPAPAPLPTPGPVRSLAPVEATMPVAPAAPAAAPRPAPPAAGRPAAEAPAAASARPPARTVATPPRPPEPEAAPRAAPQGDAEPPASRRDQRRQQQAR